MRQLAQVECDGQKVTATCLRCGRQSTCGINSTTPLKAAEGKALRELGTVRGSGPPVNVCGRGELHAYYSTGLPKGLKLTVRDGGREFKAWMYRGKVVVAWNEVASAAVIVVSPDESPCSFEAAKAFHDKLRYRRWKDFKGFKEKKVYDVRKGCNVVKLVGVGDKVDMKEDRYPNAALEGWAEQSPAKAERRKKVKA